MHKIVIVLLLGLLAVFIHWRCESPSNREQGAPLQAAQPEVHDSDPRSAAEYERGSTDRVSDSPPRLPEKAEKPRIVFDRGPRKKGEHPDRYEDRVWFTERFDAFVRESGVTDAQVQELLLAMFDYTMQRRHAMDILREDVRKEVAVDEDYVLSLFEDGNRQFNLALQRTLDDEQILIYFKHCPSCAQHISYFTHYEPILRVDFAPGK